MKVLGVDPGFANFGWCVSRISVDREGGVPTVGINPIICGVFNTAKSSKKDKVLAPNDEFRRCKDLYTMLDDVVAENNVRMICAEGMSSPRNAVTVRMLGYAWGIIASVCERRMIPLAQVSPKQLKKKVCGRISVTDIELHEEIFRRFPGFKGVVETFVTAKSKREHAIDALGATEACRNGEVFRTLVANMIGEL